MKTRIICRDVFKIQSRNYCEVFFAKKVDDDKDELFLVVWLTVQPGPLSEILTIANLRHAVNRI